MTALTLFNRHLNNHFGRPFEREFAPTWFRGFDEDAAIYESAAEMKFDQETSSWQLTVEVAGVSKKDLKLDAKEGLLTITGEKTRGLTKGKFERSYRLPEGVDVDQIEAEFEDGVLTMKMPLEKNRQAKTIAIK